MSIRRIQTERALEGVVRDVYSAGRQPPLGDITARLAKFLARNPAGVPQRAVDIPAGTADPEHYNSILRALAINLSVLYEAALDQVDDVLQITSSLQTDLQRLTTMRRKIEAKIDDYLLSLYNTDGYFYSASDTFSTTELTDLTLTSAQVDTVVGAVVLPTITSMTKKVSPQTISQPTLRVVGANLPIRTLAPFAGAIQDGLSNTLWAFEVESDTPREVVVEVTVPLGNGMVPVEISRFDIAPYGVSPVQVFVHTRNTGAWIPFGNSVQTSSNKMSFNSPVVSATHLSFTLRKTKHDYTDTSSGQMRYRYIFGATAISILEQAYDLNATFVSSPLGLPEDLETETVIDGVSLVVDEEVPSQTDMTYSVAVDVPGATQLSDFTWHTLLPIDSRNQGDKIVRFEGAAWQRVFIAKDAKAPNVAMVPIDTVNSDLAKRNPSSNIIPGVNVYRIAPFEDNALLNSVTMLEGVKTTRIYSRPYDVNATTQKYWADAILYNNAILTDDHGRINPGAEFFTGSDIGVSGRSVYVETTLACDRDYETFLAEFQKSDERSQQWDVRVFHGGRELGHLPPGVKSMQLPWTLRQGQNHISLIVQIPLTGTVPDLYTGSVNLMGGMDVHQFGETYLAEWRYVPYYDMQYKETGEDKTFTFHNGEIISRHKPSNNFLLRFAYSTGNGPTAIRFRADLKRTTNTASVSPQLRSYRLRFLYGAED